MRRPAHAARWPYSRATSSRAPTTQHNLGGAVRFLLRLVNQLGQLRQRLFDRLEAPDAPRLERLQRQRAEQQGEPTVEIGTGVLQFVLAQHAEPLARHALAGEDAQRRPQRQGAALQAASLSSPPTSSGRTHSATRRGSSRLAM
jgi:hypothetical protein